MILSGEEIRNRLKNKQILREGTWDDDCIAEVSYTLRIANDGLLINGKFYDPGIPYKGGYIEIEPGEIAILSTKARLNMPCNLMGKIGIRLEYALQGLTGLMGIQVDPLYGHDKEAERLFIRVANFGNEPIRLSPGDKVFTFELHEVSGDVPLISKESSWPRIKRSLRHQRDVSWSYVTRVQENLEMGTQNIRQYHQPLVMFGIFLLAVTILGVALLVIVNGRDNSGSCLVGDCEWTRHSRGLCSYVGTRLGVESAIRHPVVCSCYDRPDGNLHGWVNICCGSEVRQETLAGIINREWN